MSRERVKPLNLQELLLNGGGVLVAVLTLVQIAPVKVNPWSWLLKKLGRAINAEVLEQVQRTEKKLDEHIDQDEAGRATQERAYILAFNRQLMAGERHTREEFWEALASIDRYHKYCDAHPEYPNERAVHAIHNIGRVYDERQRKNDFLPDR